MTLAFHSAAALSCEDFLHKHHQKSRSSLVHSSTKHNLNKATKMHLTTALSPLLLFPALAVSAAYSTPPLCVVPAVLYTSLEKPFTLSALTPKNEQFSVVPEPADPSKETASKPIITRRQELVPTLFSLKDGKLIRKDFNAEFLPILKIFPPRLIAFVWGGQSPRSPANFTAAYACDAEGQQFLELRADAGGEAPPRSLPLDMDNQFGMLTMVGFAVECADEGKQVFVKPAQYQGELINLCVKGGLEPSDRPIR
jgi:hypothetical protein